MTNKTMLSVEREFQEVIYDLLASPQHHTRPEYIAAYEKLRDLLDKQSCGACNGCANGCKLDRESPQVEPAAPHQDEPVAIVDESDDGLFIEFVYGENGNPLKRGDKLYTEQPAPVAVVMPERKLEPDECYSGPVWENEGACMEARGWNRALDDVARLNGENPVAVDAPSRDELIKMLRHFASCANVVQGGTGAMDFVARLNGVKPLSAAAPKIEFVACTAYNMGGDGYAEQTQTCCGSCPGGCVANLNGVKP